ncbi:RagB/SusD family nutrient uptake outer membrane protein [Dysgonomonas sp. 216]|uniref:RagB/SusD family nutrient uptake outer membrane protein n=1 Tax=Dysgonomonas sp. 216 TaxID=2302934 RepID=UPI0013D67180|nr:RagB/SusD family nutrient uptake outer membrane protein [Dysgonomonas sp. 216]
MMKNIKYYLLILVCVITGVSCNDYLDVRPENEMLLDDFWQKESDVEAVVMACYRGMQEDAFMQRVILWGELRSDNMIPNSSSNDEWQIHNMNILPSNSLSSWESFYQVINYCNTVLNYAPAVVGRDANFTENDLRAKEAEVKAIRSLCYFYLMRTFRDVPFVGNATVDDGQNFVVPQISPDSLLNIITNDLLFAEEWTLSVFPTTRSTKGRMTKDAVRALLADIYLWKGEYNKCIEYCDKLINAVVSESLGGALVEVPKYDLNTTESFASAIFYRGNSTESIFELQFYSDKFNENIKKLYGYLDKAGAIFANPVYADPSTENTFMKTDGRKMNSIVLDEAKSGEFAIFKYRGTVDKFTSGSKDTYSYSFSTTEEANWIFYRITDVMLMKAEALGQLNRSEEDLREMLRIVNTTYMRANDLASKDDTLSFDDYGNVDALNKLVLLERQRELMFEGKRWFDLVRLSEREGNTETLSDHVISKYTSNQNTIITKLSVLNSLYLPIHRDELLVNKLLKQNPYYLSSSSIEK